MSPRDASRAATPAAPGAWAGARVSRQAQAPLPWRRRLLHAFLIALGWLLFVWGWQRVTAGRPELGELRVLVIGVLIAVPIVTLSWVVHNVGIHRRKGPRRSVPVAEERYDADFNGRRIAADWAQLAGASRVDILVDGSEKRFVAVDAKAQPVRESTEETV